MDEQCDSRPAVCSPSFLVADSRSHRAWHWNAQSRGRFGSLCGPKRCSPREDLSACNSAPKTIRIQTAGDSIASPPTTSGLRPRQLRCQSKPSTATDGQQEDTGVSARYLPRHRCDRSFLILYVRRGKAALPRRVNRIEVGGVCLPPALVFSPGARIVSLLFLGAYNLGAGCSRVLD